MSAGTGDEPLSVAQLVGRPADAVIVTTPQELAIADVRRCVTFCEKVDFPVAGIIENMSGYVCPSCGARANLFGSGGGEALASEMRVPFLGRIPIEPDVVTCGDHGTPFVAARAGSAATEAFLGIVRAIEHSRASAEVGMPRQYCTRHGRDWPCTCAMGHLYGFLEPVGALRSEKEGAPSLKASRARSTEAGGRSRDEESE